MDAKRKIGIVGCGTIGTEVALAIKEKFNTMAELSCVCEADPKRKELFDEVTGLNATNLELSDCVNACDLVVESACPDVVPEVLKYATQLKKEVLIISVGGLFKEKEMLENIRAQGIKIYIPSGAIGGIDLLKSANQGKIYSVEITTKKPVEALKEAPFIRENRIDLDSIIGEKLIFEGKASEAIKAFPQNINVAATLSIVGIGLERTKVKIITSRSFKKNVHEITVEGEFGKAHMVIENEPFKKNPKTSRLAAFSVIATLEKIIYGVQVGT